MKSIDPEDPRFTPVKVGEPDTPQELVDALAELRLMAIRLDLKVVGAVISSAIGLIPVTKH
ncbi:hypothetical protein [Sphingomonas faeni]|uniref:hypothetical protein n=1 Tax=Sphingomonas faeni TaxID=185950 RepID=UPI0033466139